MAPRDKTDVSINGERTTLVFGDYYRVRYGKDSAIIEDGRLESRANNGDLVFSVPPYGIGGIAVTKRRVRPSAIDAIFGSGVPKPAYADRPELGSNIDAADLAILDEEAKTAKLAKTSHPAGVPGTRLLRAASAKSRATKETLDDRLAREVDAALDPALPAAILAGAIRTGKAYADRNQVWKCGTCKKRTRRPECVGTTDAPHPAVSAPAGKRLTDRLGDR